MDKLHFFFPSGMLIYLKLLLRYSLAAIVFQFLVILFSFYFLSPSYRFILILGSMFVSDIIVTVSVVKKLEKLKIRDILHFIYSGGMRFMYPPTSGQYYLNGAILGLLQAPLFLFLMYFRDSLSIDMIPVTLFVSVGLGMTASVFVSYFYRLFGLKLEVGGPYSSNLNNILTNLPQESGASVLHYGWWDKLLRRQIYSSYLMNLDKHDFYHITSFMLFFFLFSTILYFMGIMDIIDFGLLLEYKLEILSGLIPPMFFYLPVIYILLTRNREQILLKLAKAREEMFTPTSTHISKRAKIIMIIIVMLVIFPMLYFSWMEYIYGWGFYEYRYYLNSPVATSIAFIGASLLLSAILQQVFLYVLFKTKLRRLK